MSSRRSRSRHSSASRISDDQIPDLVTKLLQILPPEIRDRCSNEASAARVLQATCNYIRSLHQEVDDLGERLWDLLENSDTTQAALLRNLLKQ